MDNTDLLSIYSLLMEEARGVIGKKDIKLYVPKMNIYARQELKDAFENSLYFNYADIESGMFSFDDLEEDIEAIKIILQNI